MATTLAGSRIEDYGIIGDMNSAALVARNGAIDWWCAPRFDSDACFSALLGTDEHGRWTMDPAVPVRAIDRRYRPDTMVLETDFECDGGRVRLVDFMSLGPDRHRIVRVVEGLAGKVPVNLELITRFGYGAARPFIETDARGAMLISGPDALDFDSPIRCDLTDARLRCRFDVKAGERVPFVLSWRASHTPRSSVLDVQSALRTTEQYWREWASRCTYTGKWREVIVRSMLTLKALTYEPTGGIVAAPTCSLPEEIGGERNWDYRYCWLRDAALTLVALLRGGFVEEATAWRDWLLRAVAGDPADAQIMYGIAGERRLSEFELPWLPGYEGSHPVRVGNAASTQFQLDVYGEALAAVYAARRHGMAALQGALGPALQLIEHVEKVWREPDDGLWEMRGGRRHFTHSKVMAWVAIDRAVRILDEFGQGDATQRATLLPRLRAVREEIRADVLARGFDAKKETFTQSYGAAPLDASLLTLPHVGFISALDPRMLGTVRAIERELVRDGFVRRYATEESGDGLRGDEGVFLACSFWLADNYAMAGEVARAEALIDRLVSLRNDLGLLAEEYDPASHRMVGNFPQAFTHVGLAFSAFVLEDARRGRPTTLVSATAP